MFYETDPGAISASLAFSATYVAIQRNRFTAFVFYIFTAHVIASSIFDQRNDSELMRNTSVNVVTGKMDVGVCSWVAFNCAG
jgi:hypothetical protein